MKKIISIVLALVFVLAMAGCGGSSSSSQAAEEKGTFVVGMECNYTPFNWTQTEASDRTAPISSGGYADGYDVQIAKLIAEGLGKELVIEKIEWDGLTMALTSGKIDAIIAGMSPTEERKLTIDFTDVYYMSELVIVVRADSELASATSLADFSGAKITGQLNTFHYSVIDQIPGVDLQTAMSDFPVMIVALTSGAIDGYVSEKPGALSAVAANPDLTFVEFADGEGFVCSPDDAAIAVGITKENADLKEKINEILAGITVEQREQLMLDALENQPLENS